MSDTKQTTPTYVGSPAAELEARTAATGLRNVLRLNSEFSVVSGVVGLVAGGWSADLIGVNQVWLVRAVAGSLLGFGAAVFVVAGSRTEVLKRWSALISAGDFGWVLGTIGVAALGWLTTTGAIIMGLLAAAVLGFGLGQIRARRRLLGALSDTTSPLNESPPVEIVTFDLPSTASPEAMWPVMTDHSLYAKLALNLKAAANVTPNGPGFQRTCTDSVGRTWSETCTLWDEGRRFDIDVDTSDYPYPLAVMQGSWRVEPATRGTSTVGMTFAFQPAAGLKGRLFVPLMHLTFPPVLKRIAKGWTAAAKVEGSGLATLPEAGTTPR